MKQIIKTIAFGMLLGSAIFLVPFLFKFILVMMVIGLFFKMIIGQRRRHFVNRFEMQHFNYAHVVPIDNQWHQPYP